MLEGRQSRADRTTQEYGDEELRMQETYLAQGSPAVAAVQRAGRGARMETAATLRVHPQDAWTPHTLQGLRCKSTMTFLITNWNGNGHVEAFTYRRR